MGYQPCMREETLSGEGGLKIWLRSWRSEGAPRAAVVLVHGFNSHGGYYVWVAEQLLKQGLSVYALDLRGRGKSDGERYYVAKFADYVSDVAAAVDLAKSREGNVPFFMLGHSAGGVVACI